MKIKLKRALKHLYVSLIVLLPWVHNAYSLNFFRLFLLKRGHNTYIYFVPGMSNTLGTRDTKKKIKPSPQGLSNLIEPPFY